MRAATAFGVRASHTHKLHQLDGRSEGSAVRKWLVEVGAVVLVASSFIPSQTNRLLLLAGVGVTLSGATSKS